MISIHAPREGSDIKRNPMRKIKSLFQSTLPVRGATVHIDHGDGTETISIHAPREGSDGDIELARLIISLRQVLGGVPIYEGECCVIGEIVFVM